MEDAQINPIAEQVVANSIPGSEPGETKNETIARLFKVKVDGQDMEVDEQELLRGYAHNKAAAKRMEEASSTRKEAEQVLRMFKENPREAFKLLGKDARSFAEQIINEELQEAILSPEQRELRQYKSQVAQYEAERRQAQEEYERETMESELAAQTESIQSDIINVLQTSGLPQTERTVGRIAYYMSSAIEAGYQNIKPQDVIDQVKQDYIHDFKSMLGGLSEDQIEMFLGTDLVRKVAKSTVKAEKKPQITPKSVNTNKGAEKPTKKIMSPRDFFGSGF